jgi:hypothetical protein
VIEFVDPDIEALQEKIAESWAIGSRATSWSFTAWR